MSIQNSVVKISASQAWDDEYQVALRQNANGFVELDVVRALQKLAKPADPPSNNMGGTYPLPPPFLPHGEISGQKVANRAKIDWLAFTSLSPVPMLQLVIETIWPGVVFVRNSHGMPGYPESASIFLEGVQYGLMGYGAQHGRNFVSLTGTACKTLTDELVEVFHDALSLPEVDASLSRIDLCFDVYKREITFDHALWSYHEKEAFKRPRASSAPELKVVGTTKGGTNLGRTMYVGKRNGHVMARIYEKGLEVFAKLPEEQRLMCEWREENSPGGSSEVFTADDWVRLEVEYKKQGKDQPLSRDMMLSRDEYFAGAYPYFAWALGRADGVRPAAVKSDFEVDLLALIHHAKRSYGSLVHSLKSLGFTDADVVQYITTGKHNDKLVRSGLLSKIRAEVDRFESENPDSDIPF